MHITVPVSPGELLDKLSILQIKSERIDDPGKLKHVRHELRLLESAWQNLGVDNDQISTLRRDLRAINEQLWEIEDAIRACESRSDFGPDFIALARSVYQANDRRADLKRGINMLLGSAIVEEKSYVAHSRKPGR